MEQLRAMIYGRVQGVSFRYFTTKKAEELGIKGWVRNCPDGSVETLAEGQREKLEAFLEFLQVGPSAARVSSIEATWAEAREAFSRFEVRY